jgi:DNA replication and repair protein RecF
MSIIKGSPQERRKFLDYDISQISRVYAKNLSKFQRLMNQRNMLLKRLSHKNLSLTKQSKELEVWDCQLIETGSQIIEKRLQTVAKLNPLTRLMQRKISGGQENIELHYIFNRKTEILPTMNIMEQLERAREENLADDLRFGMTQWGPHRDDLAITLNGINLKQYGSQGQQRTAVLALKLAELEFFRGESGEYPILLLDDVLSELDQNRRLELINLIQEKSIQCFITATENFDFEIREKRQLRSFSVNCGQITRIPNL